MRRLFLIGFIPTFAVLSMAIGFFHTEGSFADQTSCPACHFLASSLSVSPSLLVIVPSLICLGAASAAEPLRLCAADLRDSLSRSPPAA